VKQTHWVEAQLGAERNYGHGILDIMKPAMVAI